MKSIRAAQRQSSALCLGSIQYAQGSEHIDKAAKALLAQLAIGTKADVETRRYAIRSLASIAVQPVARECCMSLQRECGLVADFKYRMKHIG